MSPDSEERVPAAAPNPATGHGPVTGYIRCAHGAWRVFQVVIGFADQLDVKTASARPDAGDLFLFVLVLFSAQSFHGKRINNSGDQKTGCAE